MRCLIQGLLKREDYAAYLASLWPVYDAVEDAMVRNQKHKVSGKLYFRELERLANLEEDLVFFAGSQWRNIQVPDASYEYADHVRSVMIDSGHRLVSHAYVRYLGDLSGGQMIRRVLAQRLQLDRSGLRFYQFDGILDGELFKTKYRDRLDQLSVTPAEEDDILDEAIIAFSLNERIFKDLAKILHGQPQRKANHLLEK